MKKFIVLFLAIALISGGLLADSKQPPRSFRFLQYQFVLIGWADFSITSYALATGQFQEKNPIARLYASRPALAISIQLAGEGFLVWNTTQLWKANKTLGWAVLIGMTAARAYVLARNLKTLREHYR